jgi:Zn-dependent peptidase ImmA (M78 family)
MNHLDSKARDLAIKARQEFGFNTLEPIDILKILTLSKISCIKKPIGEMSGIYVNLDNVRVVIINTNRSVGHQNFTAAHELYHSKYDKGLASRVCQVNRFDERDESELLADLFAANFLMPEDGIYHYLYQRVDSPDKLNINDIIFLEQIFGVSHKAMLIRLCHLGIIDDCRKEELLPDIRINAKIYGYDDYLYRPSNDTKILSEYAEKARLAFERDLITNSRYEELLAEAGIYLNFDEEEDDYVD